MEQDEIYLIDLWRTVVREWKWFLGTLLLIMMVTMAYTQVARPQWEAMAWIRIGRMGGAPMGQDPLVEPLASVLERLKLRSFQDQVLKRLDIPLDSPVAALYRQSLRLEPLPYAGPMVQIQVRARSARQADRLAQATVDHLQAIHRQLEAAPLKIARDRLDELQADVHRAEAERDRLQHALQAAGTDSRGLLLVSALLTQRTSEIGDLQRSRSELAERLSGAYTFETSLAWPIYVPDKQVFPNRLLLGAAGLLAGLLLGVLAAVLRSAVRRTRASIAPV